MRYRIAFWTVFVMVSITAFYRSADAGFALIVGAFLGIMWLWIDDETRPITGGKVLPPEPWPDPPEGFTANPEAKGIPAAPSPVPLPRPNSPRESGFERDEEGALVYNDRPPIVGWKPKGP